MFRSSSSSGYVLAKVLSLNDIATYSLSIGRMFSVQKAREVQKFEIDLRPIVSFFR